MAQNQLKTRYVKGLGKKNGRPWYALEIVFPTIRGGERVKLLFLNELEIELLGLDTDNFVERDQ